MKHIIYILLMLPSFVFAQQGVGEMISKEATSKDIIVCPHSDHYAPNYTPRKNYKNQNGNAAQFIPNYTSSVPDDFRNALDFMFETAGSIISSNVPIYVDVDYFDLGGNALAQAGPGGFRSNFPGALFSNTFYPIALAEKLADRDLNEPGVADITIDITSRSTVSWNTTPDSSNIGNKFDLATVIFHELIHGLGFIAGSSINTNNDGVLSALVYSRFIENQNEINLLDNIENVSSAMRRQLTGDRLFFRNTEKEVRERYKIYAPSTFENGSSIAHLDRAVYQGTEHRLMVPFLDRGDVNYDPGFGGTILNLMGWNSSTIVHVPEFFTEDVNEDYLMTASVNSNQGIDTSSILLHYSRDSFQVEDVIVPLEYNESSDDFSFLFDAIGEETQIQYYFEFKETTGRRQVVPARANDIFFTYNWGSDQVAPVIDGHVPIESIKETDTEITIKVNDINDVFTGVDTSSLAAIISLNENLDTIPFEIIDGEFGEFFEARFSPPSGFDLNDELAYKIIIFDVSVERNQGNLPEEGFFSIEIQEVSESIATYINDFDVESDDFVGSGFRVTQPAGFSTRAIHSDHPYRNAGEGSTLNFTYELKQLIRIEEDNPIIRFDEIVIVEPGQPGTSCRGAVCPLEFWDYVVVEGNKLGTSNWVALHDAYDSRDNSDFLSAYNAERNGSSSLFKPKEISLIENGSFEIGDELFIRFRLFSDPFAVGWGWAIDNLEIQPMSTNTLDKEYVDAFEVYPNPLDRDQTLTISINLREKLSGELSLVNVRGQQLIKTKVDNNQFVNVHWDISRLTPGIYFAQLQNELGTSVRKIVIE